MQAFFRVTIALAETQQSPEATRRLTQWMAQAAFPHLAGSRAHLSPQRVDQALATAIVEQQPGVAGSALDNLPATVLACPPVLLDTITPPQAGLACQRGLLRHPLLMQHPAQLDKALGGRANLRGRCITQVMRLRQTPHAPPGPTDQRHQAECQGDPATVVHIS